MYMYVTRYLHMYISHVLYTDHSDCEWESAVLLPGAAGLDVLGTSDESVRFAQSKAPRQRPIRLSRSRTPLLGLGNPISRALDRWIAFFA